MQGLDAWLPTALKELKIETRKLLNFFHLAIEIEPVKLLSKSLSETLDLVYLCCKVILIL